MQESLTESNEPTATTSLTQQLPCNTHAHQPTSNETRVKLTALKHRVRDDMDAYSLTTTTSSTGGDYAVPTG